MKLGICLEGGGAKGSFQGGVLKALYDSGIKDFYSIAGTSIGSVNGYYLFTGNMDKLEDMWKNFEVRPGEGIKIVDNTVDNSPLVNRLSCLYFKENILDSNFYVNYVEINDKIPKEVIVNLVNKTEEFCLDSIKYSSLLPQNPKGELNFIDQFKIDLSSGMYDGYKLDGGLVNVRILNPLIDDKVDKIIIITMVHDFKLPESIKDVYNEDNIIIIGPKEHFEPKDTLRFENEFCRKNYAKGYEIGIELVNSGVINN